MRFNKFIFNTLKDISDAICEAREECGKQGIQVAPGGLRYNYNEMNGLGYTVDGKVAQAVRFDVCLTAEEDENTNASIGVVALFKADAGTKVGNKNVAQNRVKFTVPVIF